jgi:L,D-peptidoglycan transpeptidase YkuD (ErfK/YbiS/YcfS/YnhG family)
MDGWCDDPSDLNYNRPVILPFSGSHERLWRDDALYDLLVTIGFNDNPPVAGVDSAIFLHVAGPSFAPTEGCVALSRSTLVELLAECGPGDRLCINPPQEAENQH